MTEPTSSLEVERKYDVDDDTPLPDWSGLPGVVAVAEAEFRPLDAAYWDTARLDLAAPAWRCDAAPAGRMPGGT